MCPLKVYKPLTLAKLKKLDSQFSRHKVYFDALEMELETLALEHETYRVKVDKKMENDPKMREPDSVPVRDSENIADSNCSS